MPVLDNKRRRIRPSIPGGKDRGKSTTTVSRTRFPQTEGLSGKHIGSWYTENKNY